MNRCNAYYSLSSHLDTSLQGVTNDEDLERLSQKLEKWKIVGRHLEIVEARLTAFNKENSEWSEKNLWACPLTPNPQPHLPSICLCKIKMRGSSKMA